MKGVESSIVGEFAKVDILFESGFDLLCEVVGVEEFVVHQVSVEADVLKDGLLDDGLVSALKMPLEKDGQNGVEHHIGEETIGVVGKAHLCLVVSHRCQVNDLVCFLAIDHLSDGCDSKSLEHAFNCYLVRRECHNSVNTTFADEII